MTMILTTATDIQAIVGTICAVLTTILIPVVAYFLKQKRKNIKRNEIIDAVPNALDDIKTGISDIKEDQNVIKFNQQMQEKNMKSLEKRYDQLETQQLKYIINDAFFSCGGHVENIPYEVLVNAAECAEIYLAKGLNHETGARCHLIFEELRRRATQTKEDENNG
jgi:hypothetical protein